MDREADRFRCAVDGQGVSCFVFVWNRTRGFFAPPDVAFPFVWGTFVERNYVLASDINSGLWVFQVR